MICEQWFPTPIWRGKFNDISEQEYKDAINYCNFLSTKNTGRVISNIGGWQSNDLYLKDILGTPLQIFFEQIKPATGKALYDLGIVRDFKLDNYWININKTNDMNIIHNHPISSIAGCFYLTNNNSSIAFHRNRDVRSFHLDWLGSNGNTILSYHQIKYTPERGQYLIFPSWLEHSVEPSKSIENRISIAFNITVI